jgi:hypothetical protein
MAKNLDLITICNFHLKHLLLLRIFNEYMEIYFWLCAVKLKCDYLWNKYILSAVNGHQDQ